MKFRRKVFIEKGHLDMVPLINVIFLLLIFFLVSSSFIFQSGISVDLPRAVTSEVLNKESLILVVSGSGKVFLDDRELNREEILSRLRLAATHGRPILIKSDRGVPFEDVVKIWDLARQEGVKKINIATTQDVG